MVDPPRKGLEISLVSFLCSPLKFPPQPQSRPGQPEIPEIYEPGHSGRGLRRLVYLSCGYPALQRDLKLLLASGVWQLKHAEAFLFFPGSDAVEILCVLDRTSL